MKNNVTFNLNFTISKISGLLLIMGGIALGFATKSESLVITLSTVGASLIGVKTVVEGKK